METDQSLLSIFNSREIKIDLRQVNAFPQLNIKLWKAAKHLHLAKANAERVTKTPITFLPIDRVIQRKDFTQLTNKTLNMHDWFMIDRLRGVIETCKIAFEDRSLYKATESIRPLSTMTSATYSWSFRGQIWPPSQILT